jgi:SAM-dependent methyltransferase
VSEASRGWRGLHAAVLDAAAVGPGTSVLDLGCGSGIFAEAAAIRGARVTGVDTDRDAVALAASRVPGATFLVRHAQDPPPGRFDVVTAVQLLMHVADPVAVLHRAGRAGTTVTATVWGREHESELRVLRDAVGAGRPARGPAVSEPARLRAMAERAGLVVDRLDEVVVAFDYADAGELLEPLLQTPVGRTAAASGRDAVRANIVDHLAPYRTAGGGYRLHNLFRLLVARPR